MHYEFYGSFLVFTFLLLAGGSRYRPALYAALMIAFWDSYYLAFVLGIVFSDITADEQLKKKLRVNAAAKTILLAIAVFLGSYPTYVLEPVGLYAKITFLSQPQSARVCHIVSAAIIIYFALASSHFQRLLETGVANFLGKVSFSLYLLHLIVLFSLSSFLVALSATWNAPYPLKIVGVCLISLPVMLVCSWYYYKHVDAPSIRLANSFSAYLLKKLKLHRGWPPN
jgi:peptidoglycan/LPS O-acetylase OafA/YrhL